MVKEKKRGFFAWLGFNRQDDDAGSEPQAERETYASGAGGDTDTPIAATAARDEAAEVVEPALPQAQVERPDADRPSAPPSQGQSATADPLSASPVDTKIPAANRIPAADEPVPSVKNIGAAPSGIVAAAAENRRQDASAGLTLTAEVAPEEDIVPLPTPDGEPPVYECAGFFTRLKNSLVKTRQNLGSGVIGLFRGKKIDADLFEELEEQLLVADVGVETTRKIIDDLIDHADRRHLKDAEALYSQLRAEMAAILVNVERPLEVTGKAPFVILMVGVNGVGKTTTIGKLARLYQAEGKSVMLAAGDTFRAAAVEQLQVWGDRNHISVMAQQTGADSASVIFDAIQAAKARGIDVLIADTAGRLQNKAHLMDELKKIVRVMKKLDVEAPHEVMLTLDASTGQNAVSQANLFNDAVGLTGIALTKLDGTAKGGVIFAVADRFGIPIRFIGVGEAIEDLRPFKADDFIEALFARED
ncbi:signal recognition particle-docking protein FtsY [Sodalis-like symbiont of Philaenus spumarius]|nr:signal recognition particle-docking protein FtsY [Sodalis-like symbiont of Philaenus spumarius]